MWALLLAGLAAASLEVVACSYVWLGNPFRSEPANAVITIEVQVDGEVLTVGGTTDLPDGTILKVTAADVRIESYHGTDSLVNVAGGRYQASLGISGWRPGQILVGAGFAPGYPGQPPEVVTRFGAMGEQLTGPQVHQDWDRGDRSLDAWTNVVLP